MRLLSLFILVCLFTFSRYGSASILKVMIDPGHGGSDSGAVHGKIKESDISLKISQELKKILETDVRFLASLTREQDKSLTLIERVKTAEEFQAEILLSIHANSSPDPRAKGFEVYFQNYLPPDEESLFLASSENLIQKTHQEEIQNSSDPTKKNDVLSIIEDLKRQDRMQKSYKLSREILQYMDAKEFTSLRQAPFYVVSKSNMPAVLIEVGYVSHQIESEKLIKKETQQQIAQKIYLGLLQYKEMIDNSQKLGLN